MIATKGIVLTNVKYGETSIICSIFTEKMGMQSYIIKGIRQSKSRSKKANLFQHGTLLDLIVYNNPTKQLQFIKDATLSLTGYYQQDNVVKDCIVMYCVELLQQLIIDELPHEEVFMLYEEMLLLLNSNSAVACSNIPIYFTLKASAYLGYSIAPIHSFSRHQFDIENGIFSEYSTARIALSEQHSSILNDFLKKHKYYDTLSLNLNNDARRSILNAIMEFLQYHSPSFKQMKTLNVLSSILS